MLIEPYKSTIAVVMVNYQTPALVEVSLTALMTERVANPSLRAVIVDGGSGDGSPERLAHMISAPCFNDWVTLLPLSLNGGFGWANNQAIQRLLQSAAPADYIYLLNPDAVVEPGAVSTLAAVLDVEHRCAAVGSLLFEPDGNASGSAFIFPSVRAEFLRGLPMAIITSLIGVGPLSQAEPEAGEVEWVTGASTMLRAEALREVGLFDTGFFLYFEETELMWRLQRAGWSVRHEPASRVRHIGGAATGVNGSGARERRPALPTYWYRSRRRFFALTGSGGRALAASLAYLVGHALLKGRRTFGSGRQHTLIDHDGRRMICNGLRPKAVDRCPAITRWDDPVDQPPAWMA